MKKQMLQAGSTLLGGAGLAIAVGAFLVVPLSGIALAQTELANCTGNCVWDGTQDICKTEANNNCKGGSSCACSGDTRNDCACGIN